MQDHCLMSYFSDFWKHKHRPFTLEIVLQQLYSMNFELVDATKGATTSVTTVRKEVTKLVLFISYHSLCSVQALG